MKKAIFLFSLFVVGFLLFTGQKTESPVWKQSPVLTPTLADIRDIKFPYVIDNIVFSVVPRLYYAPDGVQAINPSFRVHPSSVFDQSEVYLACGRGAWQHVLYGSSNAVNMTAAKIFDGCYISTNSGATWYGSDTTPCGNLNIQRGDVAPIVAKDGRLIITHLASSSNFGSLTGMAAEYSTNFGLTFSTPYQISSNASVDKNLTGTDDSPTSPYYGNTYIAYVDYSTGSYLSYFSKTTNGGVSWTTPMAINNTPSGKYAQGHDVDAMPNGRIIVVWALENSSSPWAATHNGISYSTNGGTNWTANEQAYTAPGFRSSSFNGWGIRINDFPRISIDKTSGPRSGWIYVVHPQINQLPAGSDGDVVLNRSTDGGVTWSSGTRVNQDALNNGKVQFFPAVNVDAYGGVNVIYYDNRHWANTGDSCTVYLARSMDGGTTWTEYRICDHAFKPKTQSGMSSGYMGDYIGVTSGNNKIWGFWMDDITGKYQAWTASIDLGPAITHTPLGNTEQITGPRTVSCTITPAGSGINPSLTKLYYAKNSTTWTSVNMTNTSGTNWSADITLSGVGTYNYYVTTTDSMSRPATAPASAPANYYSFVASTDTTKPIITHTPLANLPKSSWPATVSATVTDNIGIDSVWVRWYKNTTSNYKQFKLSVVGTNQYAAMFNSLTSDVNVNDSIFYRIIAQDNSSIHNRDSSALNKLKIISLRLCENFSGGVVPPTNWTVSGSYWLYSTASGYGSGTGSAEFNFWSATSGTNEYLTSLTFDASLAGDSLKFDIAHALYNTSIDSLIIETSTNAGTSYTSLARMYAGSSFTTLLCMSTVSSTSAFTPTSAQWKSRAFVLPVGTNKVRFLAKSAYGNNLYIDNICQATITGVNPLVTSQVPVQYSLYQNYPNPFNPVTKINFDIPKQGMVSLKIYDVLGREVRVIVNDVKAPGTYSVDFNASELSSGVYFYRLESNGFTDIKRMMLIK